LENRVKGYHLGFYIKYFSAAKANKKITKLKKKIRRYSKAVSRMIKLWVSDT
jgi:hypothetical protein